MPKTLRSIQKILIHGFIILSVLAIIQLLVAANQDSLLTYVPPFGLALLMVIVYLIQPITIGVINIIVLNRFYNFAGWQIGFWLNGIFLLLVFSTMNIVLQTVLLTTFSPIVAVLEILLLSFPFGYLGKLSNGPAKEV